MKQSVIATKDEQETLLADILKILAIVLFTSHLLGCAGNRSRKTDYVNDSGEYVNNAKCLTSRLSVLEQTSSLQSLVLILEVKNNCDKFAEICVRGTPFEFELLTDSVFEVTDQYNNNLKYVGRRPSRLPPDRQKGDYMEIPPHSSIYSGVDVSDSYEFEPGKYKIKYVGNFETTGIPASNIVEATVESNN